MSQNPELLENIDDYLRFSGELIQASRSILAQSTSESFTVQKKEDNSFVTELDLAIEIQWRKLIQARYPGHSIVGEELATHNPDSDIRWILDPIDGTLSFKHGIPLYGSIISLQYRKEGNISWQTILGVIDLPALDRTLSATLGGGCFCKDRQVKIVDLQKEDDIHEQQEIVATSDKANFLRSNAVYKWERLLHDHPRVRTYSDCFGHALAILGVVGAMVDYNVCLWDIAATELLIKEAGGRFEIVEEIVKGGKPTRYSIIAGKPVVVNWLLSYFA